jgi:hypothetical protein
MERIEEILKQMLGEEAFNNSMKVQPDFARLAKTVNYLIMQLNITKRFCEEEGKDHIDSVIKNARGILEDEI